MLLQTLFHNMVGIVMQFPSANPHKVGIIGTVSESTIIIVK